MYIHSRFLCGHCKKSLPEKTLINGFSEKGSDKFFRKPSAIGLQHGDGVYQRRERNTN
jgi:hypothetical protein